MRQFIFTIAMALAGCVLTARADDWPQFLGPKRDGVWREAGIVDTLPKEPKFLWRTEVGEGYSGPAVADGSVFVTDLVRGDVAGTPKKGVAGKERVLCIDEKTGAVRWKYEHDVIYRVSYPGGPRCTPTVDGDRVFTLGAMGDLLCLDVKKGAVIWKKNFMSDFGATLPQWGFASHPLVDGDKLICLVGGTEGRGVIAFNKKTGAEIWKALSIRGDPGYCVPVIYEFGKNKKRQLIIWHTHAVVALDPESGKRLWSQDWEIRVALTIPMPRLVDGDKLFLTAFYNGATLLRVEDDKATVVWQSKKASERNGEELHSIMATPVIKDGFIYGICSYSELRCLKVDNGERVWESFEPTTGESVRWGTAFIVAHEDRYFLFNEKGDLITCKLSPKKYDETSRLHLLAPTNRMAGRPVVWTHPAFANKNCYARNDKEIVAISLAK
jgi:outer membrane protein assembly factor BamB